MVKETKRHNKSEIIRSSEFLSSQVYVWDRDVRERRQRPRDIYAEEVNAALTNILDYPHMGGKKGALMLVYHQIEYIGQRSYDFLKRQLKQIVLAEIKHRQLLKEHTGWVKDKAEQYGEIWCADFTEVKVFGLIVYIAVILDAFSHYYLGYHVSDTADFHLIDGAFTMALKTCLGVLPEKYMLNDQGSQYKSELYQAQMDEYDIEQVFIPKGTPWNNGEAEVGMRDIKALFYQRLSKTPRNKNQHVVAYSTEIAHDIFKELNEKIPRLKLRGVTPLDIITQKADQKRIQIKKFIQDRKQKRTTKTRIKDLNDHICKTIHIDCWNNTRLKNVHHLLTHNYKRIVPESVG